MTTFASKFDDALRLDFRPRSTHSLLSTIESRRKLSLDNIYYNGIAEIEETALAKRKDELAKISAETTAHKAKLEQIRQQNSEVSKQIEEANAALAARVKEEFTLINETKQGLAKQKELELEEQKLKKEREQILKEEQLLKEKKASEEEAKKKEPLIEPQPLTTPVKAVEPQPQPQPSITAPAAAFTQSTPTSTQAQPAQAQSKPAMQPKEIPPYMSQAHSELIKNQERIQWIKNNVRSALNTESKDIKSQCMDIKIELRPKFGMLTNSKSQLVKCKSDVQAIFTRVKNTGNTLLYNWTLNLYSKLLVEQSESEANAKLQNALPLAMLTVLLWNEFKELGDFVIPRIIKRCPLVIGYSCPIDTIKGRKVMGWRKDDDDTYESLESYMGRVSGICAVWACITQSKLSATTNHPYPISHSWIFVSRHLNRPKDLVRPEDYAVVAAWWDMTATRLHDAYGRQAEKVLNLLYNEYTNGSEEPAAMRLRGLGENWKETGKIEHSWQPLRA